MVGQVGQGFFLRTIDPSHNDIQFKAKDVIPCAASNLHRIIYVATTRPKQFNALLRAMQAFEFSIHIKSRQGIFLEEFQKN